MTFVEVDANAAANTPINAEYSAKYHRYAASIIDSITSPTARAATIRLVPRS